MYTYNATKAGYANLWKKASVKQERRDEIDKVARRIIAYRNRYEPVAEKLGHPEVWPLIGAIHHREASGSFRGVLHNGEHIIGTGKLTSLVPSKRGPFSTWEEAALDALRLKNWHKITEWPIERWLHESEVYNGWGYVKYKINSPYMWGATTLQQRGKYYADGKFSYDIMDTQLGIAAILKVIFEIDPSLEPPSDVVLPAPTPYVPTKPLVTLDRATIEQIVAVRINEAIKHIVNDVLAVQLGKPQ